MERYSVGLGRECTPPAPAQLCEKAAGGWLTSQGGSAAGSLSGRLRGYPMLLLMEGAHLGQGRVRTKQTRKYLPS